MNLVKIAQLSSILVTMSKVLKVPGPGMQFILKISFFDFILITANVSAFVKFHMVHAEE